MDLGEASAVVGSDGTVSIVKIVSLSPRVEKPKSKECNKSFVPQRQCFECFFFRIPMHMNVLHIRIFRVSVS